LNWLRFGSDEESQPGSAAQQGCGPHAPEDERLGSLVLVAHVLRQQCKPLAAAAQLAQAAARTVSSLSRVRSLLSLRSAIEPCGAAALPFAAAEAGLGLGLGLGAAGSSSPDASAA
jgi:hypothetical protein